VRERAEDVEWRRRRESEPSERTTTYTTGELDTGQLKEIKTRSMLGGNEKEGPPRHKERKGSAEGRKLARQTQPGRDSGGPNQGGKREERGTHLGHSNLTFFHHQQVSAPIDSIESRERENEICRFAHTKANLLHT